MIQEIIDILDKVLPIDKAYGFAEMICDNDGKSQPAVHVGNGNFKPVTKFGKKILSSYWRLNGDVKQRVVEGLTVKKRNFLREYNLKLIIVGEKKQCRYEDELVDNITICLTEDLKDFKQGLGLNYFDINIESYSTDREKIGKQEYLQDFKYKMDYIALSIDVKIKAEFDSECLKQICYAV